MDIVFAMNANSGDADVIFTLITDTVRKIMKDFGFGNGNIQYGAIVYGATIGTKLQLGDPFFKRIEDLRDYIQKLSKQTSDPRIDKALEEALKIFQGPNARPGAKQVLIVLTDKKSTSSEEVIKTSARLLEDKNIRVIPVAIGSEADPDELRSITPYKGDVIKAKEDEEPWRLAREIIIKTLTGMECCVVPKKETL